MRKGHRPSGPNNGRTRLWGRHAVTAALANPERTLRKLWGTHEAISALGLSPSQLPIQFAEVADLGRMVPHDAPHQGLLLECDPLPDKWLDELFEAAADPADRRPILVLDQVTDPHNVGAVLRSAVAFGALGIVTQDRHSPAESGALARAASGALEVMPWIRVVNLARALEEMAEAGYWRLGLTGHTETLLPDAMVPGRMALVLGAEGEGMRQNTQAHCDALAKLPISPMIESLNISNAAAIALYAVATRPPVG